MIAGGDTRRVRRQRVKLTREIRDGWRTHMRNARFFSIATAAVVALNLGAVSFSSADAAQRGGNDLCVAVSGGTVQNATVLNVVADGGTGIGDASGGSGNLAAATGNDRERNNNNHRNNNNNRNNNRNNWSAESLQSLELRLLQTDTASSGNGGVVDAAANGGVVSIQDINSGGNAGNAISVGDTHCGAASAPSGGGGKAPSGGPAKGGRGGQVRALPSTGIGMTETGTSSLLLALGALGMVGLSVGSRLERRVSPTASR
jgi:hypothetical protein